MKIYEVLLIWSTDEENGFDSRHHILYCDAIQDFKQTVSEEISDNWPSQAFDADGKFDDDLYELEETVNYDCDSICEQRWIIRDKGNARYYSEIYLRIIEL